jgi:transposase
METCDWFVGIDWATDAHQVCVIDATGRTRWEREVKHTASDVHAFIEWLLEQTGGDPSRVAVAIETPRGTLVDTLMERGFVVCALNPKQLDRFRDRFSVAEAKDDRLDALVLGASLRTDAHAFRRVRADDPAVVQLRSLTRLAEELQQDRQRLANRLREQVHRVHPALLTLCPAADEPWFWTLVEQTATPGERAALTPTAVKTLARTHRLRRLTVDAILAVVRMPSFYTAPGVVEATQVQLTMLIEHLRLVVAQHRRCGQQIERVLSELRTGTDAAEPAEHRDIDILESLPGVGRMVTATMLAEASHALADRDYATLRSWTGVAPITKRSGQRRRPTVTMRRACNYRLRDAAYHWGRVSIQWDAAARAYYDQLRARGHEHSRALRSVVDRWLRILVAMLRRRRLYDPTRLAATEPLSA